MSKLAGLVCAMVLGSLLIGCSSIEPQRMYNSDTVYYKDGH